MDDIVLMDETKSRVNVKLEIWCSVLESQYFQLSMIETKYMECKFSKIRNKHEMNFYPLTKQNPKMIYSY